MNDSKHTPTYHVNAIDSRRGRITGDETSMGWDKLQINCGNVTVATVYRPSDARKICAAVNSFDAMREALVIAIEGLDVAAKRCPRNNDPTFIGYIMAADKARAALALADGQD